MDKPNTWRGNWTFTRKRKGDIIKVTRKRNLITSYGLTQLSQAWSGTYTAPNYLAMEGAAPVLQNNIAIGASSFTSTSTALPAAGVMEVSIGLGNVETVTVQSISTSAGVTTYTLLTGTHFAQAHNAGEIFTLVPQASDDPSVIQTPIQYDSVNNPMQWSPSVSGYSSGVGVYVLSFYFTAIQAVSYITKVGLTDSVNIGQGNLHTWVIYAEDHSDQTDDLQVDCVLSATSL